MSTATMNAAPPVTGPATSTVLLATVRKTGDITVHARRWTVGHVTVLDIRDRLADKDSYGRGVFVPWTRPALLSTANALVAAANASETAATGTVIAAVATGPDLELVLRPAVVDGRTVLELRERVASTGAWHRGTWIPSDRQFLLDLVDALHTALNTGSL